jgi:hypothetical protein
MRFVREVEENMAVAATYQPMTSGQKAALRKKAQAFLAVA